MRDRSIYSHVVIDAPSCFRVVSDTIDVWCVHGVFFVIREILKTQITFISKTYGLSLDCAFSIKMSRIWPVVGSSVMVMIVSWSRIVVIRLRMVYRCHGFPEFLVSGEEPWPMLTRSVQFGHSETALSLSALVTKDSIYLLLSGVPYTSVSHQSAFFVKMCDKLFQCRNLSLRIN
jgi:hypothetical protein